MASDSDDFYADIKRVETRKYLMIKVRDIDLVALFINNNVATIPVSYKEKISKIYNKHNEVLVLFISSLKNENSSKPFDVFKSVVIGMCKIIEPPRETSSKSHDDYQRFQKHQPAGPKSYHSSDDSSKRVVSLQIEWVYTYLKSFDSLSRKCKSFAGHICKKESDLIELDEEIAQDICNIIKQEGDTYANDRRRGNYDDSKRTQDTAMEFFDFYNTIKTPDAKDGKEDYKDSHMSKDAYDDEFENKNKNKSDQKRRRVESSSDDSSRSSIKDRKRENPRHKRYDHSSRSSDNRRKYSDDSRDKRSSRSDRRKNRRREVKRDRKYHEDEERNSRRRQGDFNRGQRDELNRRKPYEDERKDLRRSPKRSSPRRISPKRNSPRRNSPRRNSPRRASPKRQNQNRDSPKRLSPIRPSGQNERSRNERKSPRRNERNSPRFNTIKSPMNSPKRSPRRDYDQNRRRETKYDDKKQSSIRKENEKEHKMKKYDEESRDDSKTKRDPNLQRDTKQVSNENKFEQTQEIPLSKYENAEKSSKHHKQIKASSLNPPEHKQKLSDDKIQKLGNIESSQGSSAKSILERIKVKKQEVEGELTPVDNQPMEYEEKIDNLIISETPQLHSNNSQEDTTVIKKKNLRNLIENLKKSQSN